MDLAIAKDVASIIKDVIIAVAAIATAIVAVYGINSWRRETEGKARFDAARSLMLTAYRARDDIRNCRSPLIVAGEFPPDLDAFGGSAEERYKAYAHVYSNRWKPVKEAMERFDAAVLDAEVVLGRKVKEPSERLIAAVRNLFVAVDMYLSDIRSGYKELDRDTRKRFRQIISGSGEHDAFGAEISAAVDQLEQVIVAHVRRDG